MTDEPIAELEAFSRDYNAETVDVSPVGAARKWVVARINTAAVDRFKTVVDPAGMRQDQFQRNPVVLWEHGKDPARGMVPIGRASSVRHRKAERDVVAKTIFAEDEFSRNLWELYRDEVLRGWSVNGRPLAGCGPPTAAERSARPELADCRMVYRSWDLAEYSGVAIPGNPEALTEAVSRGLWLPESLRAALPTPTAPPAPNLPPLRGRTFEQVEASVMRTFAIESRRLLDRAAQDAVDLARGRVTGR